MPLLTESNKLLRYLWCKKNENENFEDFLFVDETTVRILDIPLYHVRKPSGRPVAQKCTSKYRHSKHMGEGVYRPKDQLHL